MTLVRCTQTRLTMANAIAAAVAVAARRRARAIYATVAKVPETL